MKNGSIIGLNKHGLVEHDWGLVYESKPYVISGSDPEKWQSRPWCLMNGSIEAKPLEITLKVTVRKTVPGAVDVTVVLDGRVFTITSV